MSKNSVQITVNKNAIILVSLLIVALLGGGIVLFFKYTIPAKKPVTQIIDPKEEAKILLAKINKLYDLPIGELPTIATVSDKTKLQKQAFFAKAENGDKVLIYTNAKKAILYRPLINKVMEVVAIAFSPTSSPVNPGSAPAVDITPSVTKTISISIYNGTKSSGVASSAEKKLLEKYKNIKIVEKTNAVKDYTSTVVIDISGNNTDAAKNIADFMGGTVGKLLSGEKTPQGEILVIMGK